MLSLEVVGPEILQVSSTLFGCSNDRTCANHLRVAWALLYIELWIDEICFKKMEDNSFVDMFMFKEKLGQDSIVPKLPTFLFCLIASKDG